MKKREAPASPKGHRWIVDQITAAFEASRGRRPPAGRHLSPPEVGKLVSAMLEEELERLGEEDLEEGKDLKG